MRIEERGYSMITDEQGLEWVFQKLYDDGWRYLVMDVYGNVYLTNEIPRMQADTNKWKVSSCKKAIGISALKNILPNMNNNEIISIAEELGIVDWRNVAVDTPVLVSSNGIKWHKRYFAKADYLDVWVWDNGATSWSVDNAKKVTAWTHIKLAEV